MSSEWKFKALLPTVKKITFEYSDCPSMELRYHDHMLFSVVGDNFFPGTGPMNCMGIRAHYGKYCAENDPEYFRIEFLEEYHPFVHTYVELPDKGFSFIEWLQEVGDVPKYAGEDEWPE